MRCLLTATLVFFALGCADNVQPIFDASIDAPDVDAKVPDAGECYTACFDIADPFSSSGICCRALSCGFGEERCCGITFDEFDCSCAEGGSFTCGYTDACAGDYCLQIPCRDGECGPAPDAPNVMCEDGSIGGPVCDRHIRDGCGWWLRTCPEQICAPIECAPGSHCELEEELYCGRTACDPTPVCVPDVGEML